MRQLPETDATTGEEILVNHPLQCAALTYATNYLMRDEDPTIYSDEDSYDVFVPRREWPDLPLPKKDTPPPVSTSTIESLIKVHHTHVDVLKALGVDACKRYKEDQAEAVLARVRVGMSVCSICRMKCHNAQKLRAHIAKRHVQKTKHECPICHKMYGDSSVLKIHIKSHDEAEKKFTCPQCDKSYTTVGKMNEHVKKIHLAAAGPFTCALCNKQFAHAQNLKAHTPNCQQQQDKGEPQHECDFCGKKYRYKRDLTRHQKAKGH